MPRYLYQIRPVRLEILSAGATPDEDRLLGEHFGYLRDLYERGIVIFVGRTLTTGPETFGLIVFAAADDEEAHAIAARPGRPRKGLRRDGPPLQGHLSHAAAYIRATRRSEVVQHSALRSRCCAFPDWNRLHDVGYNWLTDK